MADYPDTKQNQSTLKVNRLRIGKTIIRNTPVRRTIRHVFVILLAVFAILFLWQEITFRTQYTDYYSQGRNAAWMQHSWVGVKHQLSEYHELALKLKSGRISDIYVHAGPLFKDGTVNPDKIRYVSEFIAATRKECPNIHIYAWLGQVEASIGGPLDIESVEVRKSIINTAEGMLNQGFDGIHYDIEPVYSGNASFLELLKDTRIITKKHHTLLSVASYKPEPVSGIAHIAENLADNPGYWTKSYFLKVAENSDQIAVMCYDSAIPAPSLYASSIARIVQWSVDNGVKNLIIGIPAYDDTTFSHIPIIENIGNALAGVKHGMAKLNVEDQRKVGVGIYAYWTTSDEEWSTYRSNWIGKNR